MCLVCLDLLKSMNEIDERNPWKSPLKRTYKKDKKTPSQKPTCGALVFGTQHLKRGDLWQRPMKETYERDLWKRPMEETYERDLWKRPTKETKERVLWKRQKPYARCIDFPAALCPAAQSISKRDLQKRCIKETYEKDV